MPRGIRGKQIADNTIEGVDVKDGTLTNDDISASANISQSKIDSSSGWITDSQVGAVVSNIDTTAGNVDASAQEPVSPTDGTRWIVNNTGTNAYYVTGLPWEVEIESGQSMEFLYANGKWVPTFSGYNIATMGWKEVWTGNQQSVSNIWGDGLFIVMGSFNSGVNQYGWTEIVDTTNPSTFRTVLKTQSVSSLGVDKQGRFQYDNDTFSSITTGDFSNPLIYSIRKWDYGTIVPSTSTVSNGWKVVFGPSLGDAKAAQVTNNWGTGFYKIIMHYNASTTETMTSFLQTENYGTASRDYTMSWDPTTAGNKINAHHANNIFYYDGTGSYSSGRIKQIEKWEGIMTVSHDLTPHVHTNSDFNAPNPAEPSYGTFHQREPAAMGYDLASMTNLNSNPYDWDLTNLVPPGTKAVEIHMILYAGSVSGMREANYVSAWDYDSGAYNQYRAQSQGAFLWQSGIYMSSPSQHQVGGDFVVKIGPSRRLYIGMNSSTSSQSWYVMLKGYYI